MQTHKLARVPPYQSLVKPYHIIIYNGAAFAAGGVFYFCFYYAFIVQAPIIGFMAFCAVPAGVTDFNVPVMH